MKCFKRKKLIKRTEYYISYAHNILSMIESDIISYTRVALLCNDTKAKEYAEELEIKRNQWVARLQRLYRLLNKITKETK